MPDNVLKFENPAHKASATEMLVEKRGYVVTYLQGMACPGCSRKAWDVGRNLAECHHCGTAVGISANLRDEA